MKHDGVQLVHDASHVVKDVALIVMHHNYLPHLDALICENVDCDIYLSENWRFEEPRDCWCNADLPVYDFYQAVAKRYERYVFLEYDVYCTMGARDYYEAYWHEDFVAQAVRFPWREGNWTWFKQIDLLPKDLRQTACGIVPLGCFMMSQACLGAVCGLMRTRELSAFCELRIATLAMKAGFMPISHHSRYGQVGWSHGLVGAPDFAQRGFFHPVKTRVVRSPVVDEP